jgi:Na+-driven multidrug efflux pump
MLAKLGGVPHAALPPARPAAAARYIPAAAAPRSTTNASSYSARSCNVAHIGVALLEKCRPRRQLECSASSAAAAADDRAAAAAAAAADEDEGQDEEDAAPFLQGRMQRMLAEIAAFAVPVLMVPLADPVMSLIDTVALGQMAGVMQLAALGPCSLILNFTLYTFTALSIATVSLTAERLRQGAGAERTVSAALFVAAASGAAVTAVLLTFGGALLAATGCDPALLPAAGEYLRIRALAAPAAIVTQVAQAAHLAQRDSLTPLRIVLLSIALSLAGDVALIGGLGMGIAGAAWTTVAAQCVSAALLVRALASSRVAPSLGVPPLREVAALLSAASTLGVFYLCKTGSYLLMQGATVRLPALLLAAHQPVFQLWGLCSFANTPLEQAALAFIPAARSQRERREITSLLLGVGACSGVVLACLAHGLPAVAPGLLAADPRLWAPMRSVWAPGCLALALCGLDVSSTGVLLANRQNAFVARAMAASLAALAAFLWWARQSVGGLGAVWWSLAVFFGVRTAQSLPRALRYARQQGGGGAAQAGAR